jgi:hypothetical protein
LILDLQKAFKEVYTYGSYNRTYNLNDLRLKASFDEGKVLRR